MKKLNKFLVSCSLFLCATDDKRHGPGICITGDGRYFEGLFVDNELNGNGVAIFNQGMYYEGDMLIHAPNGRGTLFLPAESMRNDVRAFKTRPNFGFGPYTKIIHFPIRRIAWIRMNERPLCLEIFCLEI